MKEEQYYRKLPNGRYEKVLSFHVAGQPANGLWVVSHQGCSLTWICGLEELESISNKELAKCLIGQKDLIEDVLLKYRGESVTTIRRQLFSAMTRGLII